MDHDFSTLPQHVLIIIMSCLRLKDIKSASETCRSWYYTTFASQIVNKFLLNISQEPTDVEMDGFVRPYTSIRFEKVNFKKFNHKRFFRHFGPITTELTLYFCTQLKMTQLFEMFLYFTNLKVLQLEYGDHYFNPHNFYQHKRIRKQKGKILEILARVQELHIKTSERKLEGAEILINWCVNIKTLHWNENNYQEKPDDFSHNILVNRNNIHAHDRLENLLVHSISRQNNSKFFVNLVNLNQTSLRSLNLRDINKRYYGETFQKFCETYTSLETLTMNGCNEPQLADICKYMHNLKTLDLDNVTACIYRDVSYLSKLQSLTLRRTREALYDCPLVELFRRKPHHITELTLTHISAIVLKELCENLPQLKILRIDNLLTTDCTPIFKYLRELKELSLMFLTSTPVKAHTRISHPECNILNLVELRSLLLNSFVPGITPKLISKLPNLIKTQYKYINQSSMPDEPSLEVIQSMIGNHPQAMESHRNKKHSENEENRAYDLTEFDFFFDLMQGTNT